MFSPITPDSEQERRAELRKIKLLGFNNVSSWLYRSKNQSRKSEHHF